MLHFMNKKRFFEQRIRQRLNLKMFKSPYIKNIVRTELFTQSHQRSAEEFECRKLIRSKKLNHRSLGV